MPGVSMRLIFVLVPLGVGEAGGQRVLAGDLFFVEVGDGRAVVDLAEAVDHAGVEEYGGGELCLARSAVADECDVADAGRVVDLHRAILLCAAFDLADGISLRRGSTASARERPRPAAAAAIRSGARRSGRGGRPARRGTCRRRCRPRRRSRGRARTTTRAARSGSPTGVDAEPMPLPRAMPSTPPSHREERRLDEELEEDLAPPRAEGLAHADLPRPLGDRDDHDGHDADAADHQGDGGDDDEREEGAPG